MAVRLFAICIVVELVSCFRGGYENRYVKPDGGTGRSPDATANEAAVVDATLPDSLAGDSVRSDTATEDVAATDRVRSDAAVDDVVNPSQDAVLTDRESSNVAPFSLTALWSAGTIGNDNGQAVAFDSQGNILVTGRYSGVLDFGGAPEPSQCTSNGLMDIFVSKRSAAGQHLWTRCFGGPEDDWGLAIAVDAADNVLLSGRFQGSDIDFDASAAQDLHSSPDVGRAFLTLLQADGSYGWTLTFGASDASSLGREVVVAQDGSVLISGDFGGSDVDLDPTSGTTLHTSNGWGDYYVIKLNPDYSYAWSRSAGGTLGEGGRGLAVDSSGNVFVAGYFYRTSDLDPTDGVQQRTSNGDHDSFLVKLSANGQLRWIHTLGGPAGDNAFDLAVDSSGNVYWVGAFRGAGVDLDPTATFALRSSAGGYDGYIIKVSGDGLFQWVRTFGGGLSDTIEGIAMYQDQYIVMTGALSDLAVDVDTGDGVQLVASAGESDAFVMMLNLAGDWLWCETFGGDGSDYGRSVAVSPSGDIAVTGAFASTSVDFDPSEQENIVFSQGDSDIFTTVLSPQ